MIEDEVDGETQARAAVQLAENVRELIRKEIAEAFKDHGFLHTLNPGVGVVNTLLYGEHADSLGTNSVFSRAVRRVIVDGLNKY